MKCRKCKNTSKFDNLCSDCFNLFFVKKCRLSLNEVGGIKKNSVVQILDIGLRTVVAEHVIKKIVKQLPFILQKVDEIDKDKSNKNIILPYSADELAMSYWEKVILGKETRLNKGIKLFSRLTIENILIYAEINNINGKITEIKSTVAEQIDLLRKKYPEIIRSLINSSVFIEEL